jgi:hypothetical protein
VCAAGLGPQGIHSAAAGEAAGIYDGCPGRGHRAAGQGTAGGNARALRHIARRRQRAAGQPPASYQVPLSLSFPKLPFSVYSLHERARGYFCCMHAMQRWLAGRISRADQRLKRTSGRPLCWHPFWNLLYVQKCPFLLAQRSLVRLQRGVQLGCSHKFMCAFVCALEGQAGSPACASTLLDNPVVDLFTLRRHWLPRCFLKLRL